MNVSWRWVLQICLMGWGLVYILKDLWRGQKDESIRDDLVSSYQTCPVPTKSSLNSTSQRGSSSLIIISEYLWGLYLWQWWHSWHPYVGSLIYSIYGVGGHLFLMSLFEKNQVCELGLISSCFCNQQKLVFDRHHSRFPRAEVSVLTVDPMGDDRWVKGVNCIQNFACTCVWIHCPDPLLGKGLLAAIRFSRENVTSVMIVLLW